MKQTVWDEQGNSAATTITVESVLKDKAIIIAGGGYENDILWTATRRCSKYAYRALICQGYGDDTLYYLSPDINLDADGDGNFDVDNAATNANIKYAVRTWAQDADELFVCMVDHGEPEHSV